MMAPVWRAPRTRRFPFHDTWLILQPSIDTALWRHETTVYAMPKADTIRATDALVDGFGDSACGVWCGVGTAINFQRPQAMAAEDLC